MMIQLINQHMNGAFRYKIIIEKDTIVTYPKSLKGKFVDVTRHSILTPKQAGIDLLSDVIRYPSVGRNDTPTFYVRTEFRES